MQFLKDHPEILENMPLLLLACGVGLVAFFALMAIFTSGSNDVFKSKGQLLLLNEQRFFKVLLPAVPSDLYVTAKVRLLDVIAAASPKMKDLKATHMANLCMDFVLIDKETSNIKMCIELNGEGQGKGRSLSKDLKVTRALRMADIHFISLPLMRLYDSDKLSALIKQTLANPVRKKI